MTTRRTPRNEEWASAAKLRIAGPAPDIRGMIEAIDAGAIVGWVHDRARPHLSLDVEAIDNRGRIVACDRATRPRTDLAELDPALADRGFRLDLGERRDLRGLRCIVARHDIAIPVAREVLDAAAVAAPWRRIWSRVTRWAGGGCFLGHFDGVRWGVASGWVYAPAEPDRIVSVELVCGSTVIAEGVANKGRQDLLDAGFRGGRRSFRISVPPDALVGDAPIEARVSGRPLPPSSGIASDRRLQFGTVESASASSISGWAVDLTSSGPACIDIHGDGRVIASCHANLERDDLRRLGVMTAGGGFRVHLPLGVVTTGVALSVRVRGSATDLDGSPVAVDAPTHLTKWLNRTRRFPPAFYARLRARLAARQTGVTISIVMPVYNTKDTWLRQAIDSVIGQWSMTWELICIDDGSSSPSVLATLRDYARRDGRIKVLIQETNRGTAFCTNIGIAAATGRYILFMDHDDVLEPDAVAKFADAAAIGPELIYGDEVVTGEDIDHIIAPLCRPAFSYDYYLSHPYIVHPICVRTDIARQVGGWDISMSISADVDFVLRVLEESRRILHVPFVLYRWRTHATSAGHAKAGSVSNATTGALQRHFDRVIPGAAAAPGTSFNQYRISYPDPGGRVAIVIPTRDRVDLLAACIDSITATCREADVALYVVDNDSADETTFAYFARLGVRARILTYRGDFNFSSLNNQAVRSIEDCPFVCFMNNDVEALDTGWLPRLRSIAARGDVGVVGPQLVYPDATIQHGGVIVGLHGAADHAHKVQPAVLAGRPNPGYNGSLAALRDYSAVSGACMLMRTGVFERMGGFDDAFAVGFGDTDLCLRVRGRGLKVLYDGSTTLLHHESASRRAAGIDHPEDTMLFRDRWAHRLSEGDPFYNPALCLEGVDHRLADHVVSRRFKARLSYLPKRRLRKDSVHAQRA